MRGPRFSCIVVARAMAAGYAEEAAKATRKGTGEVAARARATQRVQSAGCTQFVVVYVCGDARDMRGAEGMRRFDLGRRRWQRA